MKNLKRVLFMTIAFALIIAQVAMAAVAIPPDGTYIGDVKVKMFGETYANAKIKIDISKNDATGKTGTALVTYISDLIPGAALSVATGYNVPSIIAKGFTYTINDGEVHLATHIPSKAQALADKILAKLGLAYKTPSVIGTKINVLSYTYNKATKKVTMKVTMKDTLKMANTISATASFTKRANTASVKVVAKNARVNKDCTLTITTNNAAPTIIAKLDGTDITKYLSHDAFNKYSYTEELKKGVHTLQITSLMNDANANLLTTGSKTKTFKFTVKK